MAVIPRLIIGERPEMGDVGFFLSKPNVDVRTAVDADLLISPNNPALQFVSNGVASVAAATSVTKLFDRGILLDVPPIVMSQMSPSGTVSLMPYLQARNAEQVRTLNFNKPLYTVTSGLNRLVITNKTTIDLVVRFLVLAQPA